MGDQQPLKYTNLTPCEIANNNKRSNKQCPAWNEMRDRSFFDIKAGGVGFSRKPGDQMDT
jgi:hypothetical protein